jgi:hypothetical protein
VSDTTLAAALEKLAKWRKFFASWQLGTTPASDGRYKAVADHREMTILMRAELSALTNLLIGTGAFTQAEYQDSLEREVKLLDHAYEERFPGWRSLPEGLHMKLPEAAETMRKMGFPP